MPKARRKAASRKSILQLPELEQAKSGVLNSLSAAGSQRSYLSRLTQGKV
jgi:hypothetical protein